MVEIVNTGFSDFVAVLPEPAIKKIIWDKYYEAKGESDRIPCLKNNGSADLAAVCLLSQYAAVFQNGELLRQCDRQLYLYFVLAPIDMIRNVWRTAFENKEMGISYADYTKIVDFLKHRYAKWLAEMEFAKGEEGFDYDGAAAKYREEHKYAGESEEEIQQSAAGLGLNLKILQPVGSIQPDVQRFFLKQEETLKAEYKNFALLDEQELFEAYKKLETIPCRTAGVEKMADEMERLLNTQKRKKWEILLADFRNAVQDFPISNGRVFFGDDSNKTKQMEDAFASIGKFEYVMLGNDTSRRVNGKEGVLITTENLYYKGSLTGGEIRVRDISHFEFMGKMFRQGITVHTLQGRKYTLPCEVGNTEQLKYIKILDELLKIIKEQHRDETEENESNRR